MEGRKPSVFCLRERYRFHGIFVGAANYIAFLQDSPSGFCDPHRAKSFEVRHTQTMVLVKTYSIPYEGI
jgi:hypothetical protein